MAYDLKKSSERKRKAADEKIEEDRKGWVAKLKKGVSEYYAAKKQTKKMKKVGKKIKKRMDKHNKGKTARTIGVEDRLRKSGMTEEQIQRLRGK